MHFSEKPTTRNACRPYGKVGICAVVGNRRQARNTHRQKCFSRLNDVGFTIPSNGMTLLGRRGDGLGQLYRFYRNPSRRRARDFAIPGWMVAQCPFTSPHC